MSGFEGVAIGLAVAPLARGLLTDLFGQALAEHMSGQNSGALVTAMTLVGIFVTDLTSLCHDLLLFSGKTLVEFSGRLTLTGIAPLLQSKL